MLLYFLCGRRIGEAAVPGPGLAGIDDPEASCESDSDVCPALIPDEDDKWQPNDRDEWQPVGDGEWQPDDDDAWQPDLEAIDVVSHSHPDVPGFVSAVKFLGARIGDVFKSAALGLGYYRDTQKDPDIDTTNAVAAVPIDLEAVVFPEHSGKDAHCPGRRRPRDRVRRRGYCQRRWRLACGCQRIRQCTPSLWTLSF